MTDAPAIDKRLAMVQAAEPTLLDPCTCLRDGKHCRVCRLLDKHIAWLEARPEPNGDTEQCRARAT